MLFSCNDRELLQQLEKYINCVLISTDSKYDMLTAIALTLNEKIFGILEKHFDMLFPVLKDGLNVLEEVLTSPLDHKLFQLMASEKSYSITVGK